MNCLECDTKMDSEDYVQDAIQACQSCYSKLFGEGE